MTDRQVILKALTGSHNYNIQDESSDKDYKVFVLPTFEDLYQGNMYSHQVIGEKEDYSFHDIRKLCGLFFKSNLSFLEILYSKELIIPDSINAEQRQLIGNILALKGDIVRMNLPHLWNACGGMYLNKMKLLYKGTEGTQHLVDKYKMNTKQALHAYRILNFIERFERTGFEDFRYAMTYIGHDREFMLSIKNGFFSPEAYENFINFYHDSKFKTLKERYHSFEPNEKLKHRLEEIVMELVKISI